ncbi:hypothetical protein C479_10635 [Halovivax asiaticus JCM 14624]|uniref:Uncharacterized protein n=1 Tax=Halovivax asiaticus JCM 14624 TaxID=1227490 RepID=M0BEE9_9EURY|nr:hypothetical protein [Halovivax asiaticus]ELZ09271.1 hypothetical protein C479_10635 [Halovivax asiaticus JCM 14624]
MVTSVRSRLFSEFALVVLSGLVLVAFGSGLVIETSVTVNSLPPVVFGLCGVYGLAIGGSMHIDALHHAFDRAQPLIIGLTVFFGNLLLFDVFADGIQLLPAASLAIGLGVLTGTLGVATLRST